MRYLLLLSLFVVGTTTFAFDTVVEIRNHTVREPGETKHYAKMTIPESEQDTMYLVSCTLDGTLLPAAEQIKFSVPFMKGETPKKVYRMFTEPKLAWAIPGVQTGMDFGFGGFGDRDDDDDAFGRPKKAELRRAWFRKEVRGAEPNFTIWFDKDWKQVYNMSPEWFTERSGFNVSVADLPQGFDLLKFKRATATTGSIDNNLIGNTIRPFDEVSETMQIQQDSRMFLARISVRGATDHEHLSFQIPVREVLAPKDGKVGVVVEHELRNVMGILMRSPNLEAPKPDLSRIPLEHQAAALEMYAASGLAPKVNPIPTAKIYVHTFREADLAVVDARAYEKAVKRFTMVSLMLKPGVITGVGQGTVFKFRNFGPQGELDTLPLKAYVAGHFLAKGKPTNFTFADIIRLGMIHSDRMMDCAHQMETWGMIQLATKTSPPAQE